MIKLLEDIQKNRMKYHNMILEKIEDFIYRERRYGTHFAITLMYVKKSLYSDALFEEILRKTDLHIPLDTNLHAIVLDAISDNSYIKATENIQYALQKEHDNQFYISVIESECCQQNYFQMIYEAFDVLEYTIKNNIANLVIEEATDI